MFRRVLIANRGEIACRIAAGLREMGIVSIAIHSDADRGALHTRIADEAIAIGPAEPQRSYLDVERVIAAARESRADAIHPGYGFLAENATFAEAVEKAGLVFIGPTPEQIRLAGDKRAARALAEKSGVPVVPGAEGADAKALASAARRIGYPVMVKAALGGGGKGMRVVADDRELAEAVSSAARLAASAFGDDAVYIEKRIEGARHVEVQILGDGSGNAIHLFERDCSLQRRHQKVIEETPSPIADAKLRERLTIAAIAFARALRYRGAGTVEFLVGPAGEIFFLEMNTRLQVEHPVTEMLTGVDLVRAQILIAAEGRLPLEQDRVARRGHAIEARVYAEDAASGFLPQAGTAARVRWPRGPFVRVDAGVESGDAVPLHYDPILGKVIAFGADREQALDHLAAALDETMVHGVITNLPFLRALARSSEVRAGTIDTEWIERDFLSRFTTLIQAPAPEAVLAAASVGELLGVGSARFSSRDDDARARASDPFRDGGRWRLPGLG
jgi:acetyl/propionyl-CoA carboxylase alpha subunit